LRRVATIPSAILNSGKYVHVPTPTSGLWLTGPGKKLMNNFDFAASNLSTVMTESSRPVLLAEGTAQRVAAELPPAWREFIRFCADLRHGEIERLSIQDGLPVLAEVTKKKVKFHGRSPQGAAT
jgi:hypothetical protein